MSMLVQDPRLDGHIAVPLSHSSSPAMSLKSVLTTVVAGSRYLIHPQILGTIEETIKPDVVIPVTVLEPEQLYNQLEATLRLFDFYDDVFNPEFGNVLIEKPGRGDGAGRMAAMAVGEGKSVMHLRRDTAGASKSKSKRSVSDLAAGPYILHGPNVHQAWRIYNDTLDAFASGVYPDKVDEADVFHVLQAPADSPDSNQTLVPVPSKLYHTVPPQEAPLKGYRLTVPDCMSLHGVPTSISSASWLRLRNGTAADPTAALAQRLMALGAVVVGKTKSSQFGSGREWTDVAAPRNPREDGRQDAAGGSTGAASALAGYDWLRTSTGIDDALGQSFETAAAQGLFALRTSPGLLPLKGAQISSPVSNAVTILGTDLSNLFRDATAIVHQSLSSPPITFPKHVVSVTGLDDDDDDAEKLDGHADEQRRFVAAVEAFLGARSRKVSLRDLWASKPPVGAGRRGLREFMGDAPFLTFCYDFYHQYDVFRDEYQAAFGRQPTVEATVLHQWNVGKNISHAEYKDYQARIAVFRTWFDRHVMPLGKQGDAVLVMPYASRAPRYTAPKPATMHGVTTRMLGSLLGAPQVLAP
ncbi:hypothetical protein E4U41_003415, partial [Claviceps citrina]